MILIHYSDSDQPFESLGQGEERLHRGVPKVSELMQHRRYVLRFLHRRFLACTLVRCAPPVRVWAGEGIVGWRVQWQGFLPSHARLSILVLFEVSIPSRYSVSMIQSSADKRTAATFLGLRVRSLSIDLLRVARRKLA